VLTTQLPGERLRSFDVHVADEHPFDIRVSSERPAVQGTDPPSPQ
jgi:hypothetical protein